MLIPTGYHMMISEVLLNVSKERLVENASVPEIVSSGTNNFCEKSSILILRATAIFTWTLQVRDRQLFVTGLSLGKTVVISLAESEPEMY